MRSPKSAPVAETSWPKGEADELYFAYVEGPDGVVIEMMEMK